MSVRLAAAMAATALASLGASLGASAQEVTQEATGGAADMAQAATQTFNIPPQPLAEALISFGRQAGLQVSAESASIQGISSPGVRGTMTRDQALNALLSGTGMVYRINGPMVAIERPGAATGAGAMQLDPVQVHGIAVPPQAEVGAVARPYAGGYVDRNPRVGILGNRDYMETPFSISTYTEKLIRDQQAVTVSDVVQNDPSVRATYGQGSYDDRLQIRGFNVLPRDFSLNGLYGIPSNYFVDLTGVERVEIFRGPTAMLNGMPPSGAVGGTINLVPKRAGDQPLYRATGRFISDSQFGGSLDLGRRFADNALGVRLNAAYTSGQTTVDRNADQLLALTAGIDYRGVATRLDADLGYQKRRIDSPRSGASLAAGVQVPAAPFGRVNFYQPWEYRATDDLYGLVRLEHDFAPNLTGFLKVGGRRSNDDSLIQFPTITDAQGTVSGAVARYLEWSESVSAEAGARAQVDTGPIGHNLALSGTYLLTQTGFFSSWDVLNPLPSFITTNIYAPMIDPTPAYTRPPVGSPPLQSQTLLTGIGLMDRMTALQDKVELVAGLRYQRVQVANYDNVTGVMTTATPGYDSYAWTPAVALVVRPWKEVSFYGNFIQALEQGAVAGPGLANAGEVFAPFVSTQFEIGAKLDLGTFGATLSAFQITRASSLIDATTNKLTVDGQQRNRGLELMVFGEPIAGFKPLGGITLLEGTLLNTAGGLNNGKVAPGVPSVQLNLGADWETPFLKGFALSGRIIYTGASYLDAANTQLVPDWTRIDLGARYVFERADGKPLALRFNVTNVGNASYWMNPGFLSQGMPRTAMLSLTADF